MTGRQIDTKFSEIKQLDKYKKFIRELKDYGDISTLYRKNLSVTLKKYILIRIFENDFYHILHN